MGKIFIQDYTTKYPITMIGREAGICYGSDISNQERSYKRGIECIRSGHGRTLEFPDVYMVIDGYSARVLREWYTHIGCLPTRLQASTRYIDYHNFKYIIPHTIKNNKEAKRIYNNLMHEISDVKQNLESLGIPKEDSAMVLPIAMETVVIDKRNLRNLIDMSRQRMCNRAYWEYRELFEDILHALSEYSEEWKYLIETQMMPKCEYLGYCPEQKSCGRKSKK